MKRVLPERARASFATGLLLCVAAATAHAQSPALEMSRAVTQADTFEMRFNGQVIGTQVVRLVPEGDGYRFSETTTVTAGSQTTEVLLTRAGHVRSVTQRGTMRGQDMRIDVTYDGGRATGQARTPAPDGMKDVAIDHAVPADVIDDNVLAALLPALSWSDGATHTVHVFASGQNALTPQTLRVVEAATTGTVPTWRIAVSGGNMPISFYVERSAPHRLMRIELPGSPLEVVRKGS